MKKIILLLIFLSATILSAKTGVVSGLDPNGDGFLSIRTKPKGAEIGRLYNGNKVKILKKSGKWYKIKTSSGKTGWSHGNWIMTKKVSSSKKSYSKPKKRRYRNGDYVCHTYANGKNGWCGYVTQKLSNSVRIENYKVRCGSGGFLGICTNISFGACGGHNRLFVDGEYEARDNPRSIIVPTTCLN